MMITGLLASAAKTMVVSMLRTSGVEGFGDAYGMGVGKVINIHR